MNIIALLILSAAWIFGGALLFSGKAPYTRVLMGWSVLNLLVLVATSVVMAIFWALERVVT